MNHSRCPYVRWRNTAQIKLFIIRALLKHLLFNYFFLSSIRSNNLHVDVDEY